jgi:hypothetical protein
MTQSSMPLADDASRLLEATLRVRDDASVGALASALGDVEQALRALSSATQEAAHSLIPPARIDESVVNRYARAAEVWPRPFGAPPPTHERQAELLTALDDARATVRAAAECCRRAREILASTAR